jgi:hypothetical protein
MPLPIGTVSLLTGPYPCNSIEQCYRVRVSCESLAEPEEAVVAIRLPAGPSLGVILFLAGASGTQYWTSTGGATAAQALADLVAAGYTAAQLRWMRGWNIGAAGRMEGLAKLGCRPATVAQWIHDYFGLGAQGLAYCATGNSAGADQLGYVLARYGRTALFDAAVLTSGPTMSRVDIGCLRDDPANADSWFEANAANVVDQSFGFPGDGTGPCSVADPGYASDYRDASIVTDGSDYRYPATATWFLIGADDDSQSPPHARSYFREVAAADSPMLHVDLLPGTGHQLHRTELGAGTIRDTLLRDCRSR